MIKGPREAFGRPRGSTAAAMSGANFAESLDLKIAESKVDIEVNNAQIRGKKTGDWIKVAHKLAIQLSLQVIGLLSLSH